MNVFIVPAYLRPSEHFRSGALIAMVSLYGLSMHVALITLTAGRQEEPHPFLFLLGYAGAVSWAFVGALGITRMTVSIIAALRTAPSKRYP